MKHLHLDICDSTQEYLKEQLTQGESEELLVSCENQINGTGRNQKVWQPLPQSLFMSFTLSPHHKVTWTAIEISVILSEYFLNKFGEEIKLKWPNDIYDQNDKKCCGILVQQTNGKYIVGIGINLLSSLDWGGIFKELPNSISKKDWCSDIYQFITNNRIHDTNNLKKLFISRCIHFNKLVTISEGDETYQGTFSDLGEWGEAILTRGGDKLSLYNGSLRW